MKLYNLGKTTWEDSQLIYHALAEMGREGLSLVSPATPYVCIGFHQDISQEIDLDFCRDKEIPIFRRDLGGGAVYLDGDQLFFHLILRRTNPLIPRNKTAFYRKFIQPVVNVYRHIGINAEYKPINDIIVENRKISGTGVGEIGDCVVFVGNLIVDFNYKMMARVLKVPDEKFRDKVHKSLSDNLSTIRKELGREKAQQWSEQRLNGLLADEFEKLLGPMTPVAPDTALKEAMATVHQSLSKPEWLFQKGRQQSAGRDVKIRAGEKVVHRMHKAPGGLIRADFERKEDHYGRVSISGDFFCFPEQGINWLELWLQGKPIADTGKMLENFYKDKQIETPGIDMKDWMQVFRT
jgi:lipoate---protein ligase